MAMDFILGILCSSHLATGSEISLSLSFSTISLIGVYPYSRTHAANLLAVLGICFVVMLIALDQTVVGTAMPRIIADLKGYALYPWTASAYLLTNAVMMLVAGRLGDLHGRKTFVLASVIVFTIASALCGLARSMPELIAARVLQGLGGGTLTGVAFACVTDLFPDRVQRVRWQAMLSATFGVASAFGPTLGGYMTEHFGWRTVFYVNVPIAVVAFPMAWRFLPRIVPHVEDGDRSIDWLGVALFAVGISMLLLGTESGQSGGFLRVVPLGMMCAGAVLCVLFVRHQLDAKAPLVPARLILNPAMIRLSALSMLAGTSLFLLVFYSPLLMQGGMGLSPRQSGLIMTPLLVCITFGSLVNGRMMPRLKQPERVLSYGFLALGVSSMLLAVAQVERVGFGMPLVFGVCGLSLGFQLPNLTIQMQSVAERRDVGVASALVQTTRVIGSLLGATLGALVVNVLYTQRMDGVLAAAGLGNGAVRTLLESPQILVRAQEQQSLVQLGLLNGFQAAPLLQSARDALINSVHYAYGFCSVLCLLAFWIGRGVPPLQLHKGTRSAATQSDGAHTQH